LDDDGDGDWYYYLFFAPKTHAVVEFGDVAAPATVALLVVVVVVSVSVGVAVMVAMVPAVVLDLVFSLANLSKRGRPPRD
jgi:hypothetical protein